MTAPAVLVRSPRRESTLILAAVLLLGSVLAALGPAVGLVHSYDGSPIGAAALAGALVLLPGLLAVATSLWRPDLGVAVTAGAGLVAAARLVGDIGALTDPDNAVRPELFYETSVRALPFSTSAGAVVVLVGDLTMLVAGVLAARRLAALVPLPEDGLFGGPAVGDEAGGGFGGGFDEGSAGSAEASSARSARNNPLIFVGFLGVLALLAGSLAVPYSGGYVAARALPPALGLWSVIGTLLLAVVATVAVLVAAILPRELALALLGGTALAAVVPALTALLVGALVPSLTVSGLVWLAVAGGVLLVGAALLARVRMLPDEFTDPDLQDVAPASSALRLAVGALGLLAAVLALLAFRLPGLLLDGARDPAVVDGFPISAAIPAPFGLAGLLAAVAAVLALIPPTARAGRAAAGLTWAPMVYAVTLALVLYSEVVASAGTAATDATGSPLQRPHTWTVGPGLWMGIAGTVVAVVAAGLAVLVSRRDADASSRVADEDSAADHRRWASAVATGLVVAVLIVGFLPTFGSLSRPGPSLRPGYGVDSVGVWLLTAAMIGGVVVAARSRRAGIILGSGLAAAAIGTVRLVVPASTRAGDGFALQAGYPAVIVLAVLIALATGGLVVSAARIRVAEVDTGFTRQLPSGKRRGQQSAPVRRGRP